MPMQGHQKERAIAEKSSNAGHIGGYIANYYRGY